MPKYGAMRFIVIAVALGLLIFLALATTLPSPALKPLEGLSGFFQNLFRAGAKVRALAGGGGEVVQSEERAKLLAELSRVRALEEENGALRTALGLGQDLQLRVMPASNLGFLREGRDEFILISRGRADGLVEGALVVDGRKVLIGTVVSLSAGVAKVKLLTSPSLALEVVIEPLLREPASAKPLKALLRGRNSRELEINLVPQGAAVEKGDLVLASRGVLAGRPERFLVGEVREVKAAENQVFIPIRALHLFDPFTTQTVFTVSAVHE